jgi:hypothetical protein
MKIRELIAELQELPEELDVIVAKDAEGNGYSPLENLSERLYKPDSPYSGSLIDEDQEDEFDDEEEDEGSVIKSVVLWPTN